jgi:hypothetical protein
MNDYREEYRAKDDAALIRSQVALANQTGAVAAQRREAIAYVMAERGMDTQTLEPRSHPASSPDAPVEVRAARKLCQIWTGAQNRGLECTLSTADVRALLEAEHCYYTGMALDDEAGQSDPRSRTLDRVDASQGYTPDNTVACSNAANTLKNQVFEMPGTVMAMTPEQMRRMAVALTKHCEGAN